MPMEKKSPIYTILVGGAAGDGAKEAAINFGRLAAKHGYEFFLSVEYPSLIRGGHNYARVSISSKKVFCDSAELDAVVALNDETVEKHRSEIKKGGMIFLDSAEDAGKKGLINIPASAWVKEENLPRLFRASALLGAVCRYYNFDIVELNNIFKEIFGEKAGPNILLAKKGYEFLQSKNVQQVFLPRRKCAGKMVLDGNEAFSEGLVKAGLKNYFGYPMTPSSSILHYLAKKAKEYKLKVVQPENEISVINMALGASYAGSRTAIASTGGGFALMLEAMAFAGVAEIPIVVVDAQRASTSTGVPTRTGQGDLDFVRHLPGEYPRIVLAPGDADEAYLIAGAAMNLAWKFQSPAVVLLDKHLSESVSTVDLQTNKVKIENPKIAGNGAAYRRYAFSPDGVSALAFPGEKGKVVKISSYEHDEDGYICDGVENAKKMCEKRFAKTKGIVVERKKYDSIKIYGDKKAKNAVIFWGSVKGPMLEAMRAVKRPYKAVQIVWLEPFDTDRFLKEIKGVKKLVIAENNFTGQLAKLIREKTGVEIKNKILKYDSLPFDVRELAKKLDKIF
ncbi:MAG: 2-oxoacid:acceptor oxidoreductase subunit alpha [Candidatus Magasanikbacteria bacterium]|nr:2-oxoacid:acceptor oxidoreductase subunit alpha [Candidatus Magasanikbacteria bacterium]